MGDPQHPLVESALRTLVDGQPLHVDRARLPQLEAALAQYFERPDLSAAVRELMLFALFLGEKEGAREAAMTLLEVASAATPVLEARAAMGRDGLRQAFERAASFMGQSSGRAPMLGEPKPEGATAVRDLLARLPSKHRG